MLRPELCRESTRNPRFCKACLFLAKVGRQRIPLQCARTNTLFGVLASSIYHLRQSFGDERGLDSHSQNDRRSFIYLYLGGG